MPLDSLILKLMLNSQLKIYQREYMCPPIAIEGRTDDGWYVVGTMKVE